MTPNAAQVAGVGPPSPSSVAGVLAEFAPAKINLTLQIKGRRADGYHELESLVCFADFGDTLEFTPGSAFSSNVEGPFAGALEGGGNLVERAARDFASAYGVEAGGAFHLTKRIPVAAGLGGGSADAAAALRLLARHYGKPEDLAALIPLVRALGADIPCCLFSRAALMAGIGEKLHPLPALAPMPALLVNPMAPLATRDVFRLLAAGSLRAAPGAVVLPDLKSGADLVAYAAERSNDLEGPACRLLPVIGDMLSALRALPGCLLARLSGSGPTCYGLFASIDEACSAADRLSADYPGWWVRPVTLR